jgi:hypothetical protein
MDFNKEQLLMSLIHRKQKNTVPKDSKIQAQLQHLQEEYVQRRRDKENLGHKYIEELVREKMYRMKEEEESKSESRGEEFKDFNEGSRSQI